MTKRLLSLSVLFVVACSGTQTPPGGSSGAAGDGGSAPQAGTTTTGETSSTAEATGSTSTTSSGGASATTGGGAEPTQPTLAQLVAKGDAAGGAKLYEENHCKGCHGTPDKPGKKFPNVFAADYTEKKIDDAFAVIKKGKSPMPGFGDKLDDKAIADLVAYFKSSKK